MQPVVVGLSLLFQNLPSIIFAQFSAYYAIAFMLSRCYADNSYADYFKNNHDRNEKELQEQVQYVKAS